MKLTRCSKGHFYDADSYAFCPHCPPDVQANNAFEPAFDPEGETRVNLGNPFAEEVAVNPPPGNFGFEENNNIFTPAPDVVKVPDGEPEPFAVNKEEYPEPALSGEEPGVSEFNASDILNENINENAGENEPVINEEVLDIKDSEAGEDNFIPPYVNPVPEESDEHTVGAFSSKKVFAKDPVVGWLVCLEGVHAGEDFRLVEGRNFIGRGKDMNVCLSSDRYVSRNKHLVLTFEPLNTEFIVQPGESKELSYLNGNVILQPEKIKAGDIIKLGRTVFRFVPYCSKEYNWDN